MGGRNQPEIGTDDGDAMEHLGARRRRQVLRGFRRLHDRRRPAVDRARVPDRRGGEWHRERRQLGGHPGRGRGPWRIVRLFRPQAHVHRRDDHFRGLPRFADPVHQFRLARHLPVRPRLGARLRLSHRAHDHLGEHPEQQSREARPRRLRLPGDRRARRHRRRLSRPRADARARRLALDVRHRHPPGARRHDRALLHHRKRQLARGPRRP